VGACEPLAWQARENILEVDVAFLRLLKNVGVRIGCLL
jgi:hypothetical protein